MSKHKVRVNTSYSGTITFNIRELVREKLATMAQDYHENNKNAAILRVPKSLNVTVSPKGGDCRDSTVVSMDGYIAVKWSEPL